ncbi:MAG: hypothetical protein HFI67_07140 [Lachnospiraceae bacterium]|jgi:O-methyltransferase|nr:hypothetical protein [Lachnospiraceae bacterium]
MKIILFGSGQGGRMAARWLPADKTLMAFADSDPQKQGTRLDGVPVVAPEKIPALAPDLVWITVLNREAAASIESRLRTLGYGGPIETLNPFRERMDLRLAQIRLMAQEINAANLPGAVAELGVYQGALAAELNCLFPDRTLYLFDTFTGFPPADVETERRLASHTRASAKDFSDTSQEQVLARLPHPEKAVFCKGRFPETLPPNLPPLAFVSLDPDLYEPTYSGLLAFWPKLVPGGAILIHDYNSAQFPGAGKALRRFCQEQGLMAIPLADLHGSAILLKQK